MDRNEAVKLLKGGQQGVQEWNRRLKKHEGIPLLNQVNLCQAKLAGVDLGGADLRQANLSGADLTAANLAGTNLSEADLSEAVLAGTNLHRASLLAANLSEATLSKANLRGANLERASLRSANLGEANLIAANLRETVLDDAHLATANLGEAVLQSANLSEADLSDSNLTGANLSSANLTKANLRGANLRKANLGDADLCEANLSAAICDQANFTLANGLHGRFQVTADKLAGAERATYSWRWDVPTWDFLRNFGSLPLFGVSYLGIISIWVWAMSVELLNFYLQALKTHVPMGAADWLVNLPAVPLPKHMGFTLLAVLLLAAAATLYRLFCPAEIQESSETRWVFELRQNVITYRGLACSRFVVRWLTAICYVIGGPWLVYLLGRRVAETIRVLL